ncbi:MAG: ABC transporter ATP-binding protein [Tissierellia bacterium]|nr:ABC transporter ATP-binding protein [Tissierellia bacterium]
MDPRNRRRGLQGISGGRQSIMPVERPKDTKYTLQRLWYFFKDEKRGLVTTFLLIFIYSLLNLMAPYLIGKTVDVIATGPDMVNFKELKIYVALLLLVYFLSNGLIFLQEYIVAGIAQRVVYKIRERVYDKLQVLPIIYFDSYTHGEIMSRISNDVDNISNTISQSTVQFMASAVNIMGSLAMMLYLSRIMTVTSLITVPMVFLLTKSIANRTRVLFLQQQRALGRLNGHIEESISGIYVIKAFSNEERVIEKFKEQNQLLREVGVRAQIWSGFLMPLMNVIANFGFAVVAIVGSILVVRNTISLGIVASFISYSKEFTRPLNEIASTFNTLQSGIAGAERVFQLMDEEEERKDGPDAIEVKKINGEVEFKNVSFEYKKGEEVLKDVSFKVEPGTNVALVGPTGAGKTTIVNLLTGFYEIEKGEILIDGINIKDYKKDSLRRIFGMVLQDTYLFSGTIRENIRYGRLDATDEEIIEAAKMSRAHEFIDKLPKGYDTVLVEGGHNLSQGQRQLLAISRAILADPSILILDEATSNVDTRTELKIQEAMFKLMEGRTTFIIAHRLSTIRDADIIMLINNGEIIEKGSHKELINKKGAYYNLYMSQFENKEKML